MIGWLDCAAGASGDMLLGAVVDAGVPVATLQEAVDAVDVEPVRLSTREVARHGIGAVKVDVAAQPTTVTRTWGNIRSLLENADLHETVRTNALDVFARLAVAEARVHRTEPEHVHFHEVGALDAIADVVGGCAGLHALGITQLTASRVALGSGMTRGEHGLVPVPGPAVLELLSAADAPTWAGFAQHEMCTPTGAALLATHVIAWGPLPPMTIRVVGTGAGSRDVEEVPNVLRLVVGEPAAAIDDAAGTALLLETNVDDLDPRLWPHVLSRLLDSGAADAWLSPILMKKGRPAHTLHILCAATDADAVRQTLFAETSTIGLRETTVGKRALDRSLSIVDVAGHVIHVKTARHAGRIVNASIEYEDVVAAATALGRPVKAVLAEASAAAQATGLLP